MVFGAPTRADHLRSDVSPNRPTSSLPRDEAVALRHG